MPLLQLVDSEKRRHDRANPDAAVPLRHFADGPEHPPKIPVDAGHLHHPPVLLAQPQRDDLPPEAAEQRRGALDVARRQRQHQAPEPGVGDAVLGELAPPGVEPHPEAAPGAHPDVVREPRQPRHLLQQRRRLGSRRAEPVPEDPPRGGLRQQQVRAVAAHREAVGERQAVGQHLHPTAAPRVVPQQPPRRVAGHDDAQELPPLEPRARLGEVDGAGARVDLDAVGEAEGARALPPLRRHRPRRLAAARARRDHAQAVVGVGHVELPRVGVELEAQRAPALVLAPRVLGAPAAVQPACTQLHTYSCSFSRNNDGYISRLT
uniref:Uncharacterized protein n=1 Tax=Zea mays TaxID=4577 RepID=A0A804NYW0_MAIZE